MAALPSEDSRQAEDLRLIPPIEYRISRAEPGIRAAFQGGKKLLNDAADKQAAN